MTTFGKIMAGVLLLAMAVAVVCSVIILEGIGTPWGVLAISAGIAVTLAVAFNLERRRV